MCILSAEPGVTLLSDMFQKNNIENNLVKLIKHGEISTKKKN